MKCEEQTAGQPLSTSLTLLTCLLLTSYTK